MKTTLFPGKTIFVFGFFSLILSGCYTERAVNGDDQRWYRGHPADRQEYSYNDTSAVIDSAVVQDEEGGYYTDNYHGYPYYQFGFYDYYPYDYWAWYPFAGYSYPWYYYPNYGYNHYYSYRHKTPVIRELGSRRPVNAPSNRGEQRVSASKITRVAPNRSRQVTNVPRAHAGNRQTFARQQYLPNQRSVPSRSYSSPGYTGGGRSYAPSVSSRSSGSGGGGGARSGGGSRGSHR